jgi:hypothetical protein
MLLIIQKEQWMNGFLEVSVRIHDVNRSWRVIVSQELERCPHPPSIVQSRAMTCGKVKGKGKFFPVTRYHDMKHIY